jgi:hypothetical protein
MCLFTHDLIVVEPATAVNEPRTPSADTWIYLKSLVHFTKFFGKRWKGAAVLIDIKAGTAEPSGSPV